jgi:Xaa-Pro aminopeptidase
MVFAVETPFYGADLGPIMLEDLVLVTADGPEYLTHLPRTLTPVGG